MSKELIAIKPGATLIDGQWYATVTPDNGKPPAINRTKGFDTEEEATYFAAFIMIMYKLEYGNLGYSGNTH